MDKPLINYLSGAQMKYDNRNRSQETLVEKIFNKNNLFL